MQAFILRMAGLIQWKPQTFFLSLISSAREQEGTSVENSKSNLALLIKHSLSLDETKFPHEITGSL